MQLSFKEIGEQLCVSESVIKKEMTRIYQVLNINNYAEFLIFVEKYEIIDQNIRYLSEPKFFFMELWFFAIFPLTDKKKSHILFLVWRFLYEKEIFLLFYFDCWSNYGM